MLIHGYTWLLEKILDRLNVKVISNKIRGCCVMNLERFLTLGNRMAEMELVYIQVRKPKPVANYKFTMKQAFDITWQSNDFLSFCSEIRLVF